MNEAPFPIIDAHHHIWLLERTPWLNGPPAPRIFGPHAPIRRDYPIGEFALDVKPHGVAKSVYIQVNLAPGDEIWEVEWAAREGAREGLVQAIVGFADLASPQLGETLDRQRAAGPLRGLRQQMHWHERPDYRFAARPDALLDPAFQAGLRALAARGLHFELQVFPSQFADALRLIDAHPNLRFMLLHCGMPEDASPQARASWAAGLARFAERPQVFAKISGLGTFARRCDAQAWAPIIARTIDTFGPGRCLFGSNFLIEKLWTDYASLLGAVRHGLSGYSPEEQRAILHDNAAAFYSI